MSESQDLSLTIAIAELISSRLSHEIVGPVGAISNGLELIEELGADAGEDATSLVSASAQIAGARLQFYRMAYGRAGYGMTNLAQLKAAATGFFEDSQGQELSWPLPPVLPSLTEGEGRILLILTEVARDCLVRDGLVRVDLTPDGVTVTAEGADCRADAAQMSALVGSSGVDDLTPRTVHGALANVFAEGIGKRVKVEEAEGKIHFELTDRRG